MSLTDKLQKRAEDNSKAAAKSTSKAAPSPYPQSKGGASKDREAAAGPKTLKERQGVAEEKTALAKAGDQEDTREETSGDERHDLVTGKEINIPPSIIQERLRNGQNPETGEPWTRNERMAYDKNVEQSRQAHAKAVRESEIKMREDAANANRPAVQPVAHVPTSFLTDGQKKAMQASQDKGESPIAQARARDNNAPDELGRQAAERDMNKKDDLSDGVDDTVEQQELDGVDETDKVDEDTQDADQVQADLDRQNQSEK